MMPSEEKVIEELHEAFDEISEETEDSVDATQFGERAEQKIRELFENESEPQKDFDPMQAGRVPRMEGYAYETSRIHDILQERGDQRIGQFLINTIRMEEKQKVEKIAESSGEGWQYAVERILWNLEAPELLEIMEDHVERM